MKLSACSTSILQSSLSNHSQSKNQSSRRWFQFFKLKNDFESILSFIPKKPKQNEHNDTQKKNSWADQAFIIWTVQVMICDKFITAIEVIYQEKELLIVVQWQWLNFFLKQL